MDNHTMMQQALVNPFPLSLRKRVLVVEDDRSHSSLMKKILEDCGCNVSLAENGLVALIKLESKQIFDLIIMDWDMPSLDGLETTRIVRARQAERLLPYIPIIAFTEKHGPGDREECLASGMDGYLHKDIWLPRWRQTLIDILQGTITGNFDVKHVKKTLSEKSLQDRVDYSIDEFDDMAFRQAASILKDDIAIAIEEYLEDARSYLTSIQKGISSGDIKKIEKASHPLKSSSRSFGLSSVSCVAERINMLSRHSSDPQKDLKDISRLYQTLEKSYAAAEARLHSFKK
jgi:two-component system, sensor histidine kinase and response regulator